MSVDTKEREGADEDIYTKQLFILNCVQIFCNCEK